MAVQTTGFVPVQTPAWQVSVCEQASPSLQALPFALAGLEQGPLAGSQTPASWHWSRATQTTGVPLTQLPAWQVSFCEQTSPTEHSAPSPHDALSHIALGLA